VNHQLKLVASSKPRDGRSAAKTSGSGVTILAGSITEAQARLRELEPRAANIRAEMGVGEPGRPWPFHFTFDLAPAARAAPRRLIAVLARAPLDQRARKRVEDLYYDPAPLLSAVIPALGVTACGKGLAAVTDAIAVAVERAVGGLAWRAMLADLTAEEQPPAGQRVGERAIAVGDSEVVIELRYAARTEGGTP
jgi:hypothetical protein